MVGMGTKKLGKGYWRRILRAAIWAGLAAYATYLSASAMADPLTTDLRHAAGPLGVYDLRKIPGLGADHQEKAALFQKPTAADPRKEVACLALNIYFEARGEPNEGKLAVAHVVMNRVASDRFPDTVCNVVRQGGEERRYRCQFSWWCDGRSDTPRSKADWQRSNEIALQVYWGRTPDPTDGALWYHADYVKPSWRHDFVEGPVIGRHIFYRMPEAATHLASRQVDN
jgi:spore germination cell wall hydrolase CwlJ-like protein